MSLSRIVMRLARNPGTEFAGGDDHRGYALTAPLTLECSVAELRLAASLGPEGATREATTYSILRLGRLSLPRELRGETLRLRAGTSGAAAQLLVKQLILTPSKSTN